MKKILALCALASAIAGCLTWDEGIRCRTNLHCPSDMVCEDEVCVTGDRLQSTTDGGTSDAGH